MIGVSAIRFQVGFTRSLSLILEASKGGRVLIIIVKILLEISVLVPGV